eukprot:02104.XXX_34846_36863_1 [CDS] Oithona nana genome sequencing.
MNSSSSNNYSNSVYGNLGAPPIGMGSLQNLNRSGSSLAQLSRAAIPSASPGSQAANPGTMGFNSAVGGGRITPTSIGSSLVGPPGGPGPVSAVSSFNSAVGGGFSSGFGPSQQPPSQLSRQLGILQNNSMPSASVVTGRNPLFSRDRNISAFDPSEFPSLGSRENNMAPNPALGTRSNYVGMVKQPAMEASEFTMSNEDFPALPGVPGPNPAATVTAAISAGPIAPSIEELSVVGVAGVPQLSQLTHQGPIGTPRLSDNLMMQSNQGSSDVPPGLPPGAGLQTPPRRGIQTSPSGMVTNIPSSMVTDQFGMIGLLTFIRAAETDPNLVSLALGADLTTLGLNLNSEINLYPTFGGPWADTPCRPQDIDYHVPFEYLTNTTIRDKLAPVKLNRYKDDVLFYMFYTNVGDVLQLAAAAELYNRDWRYHKEDRVWITRAPGMPPSEKTQAYERGTYYFFDVNSWRKVPKEFHLDYDKLEDRPSLPPNMTGGVSGGVPPSSTGSPAPPMGGNMGMQPPISSNMNSGPLPPSGGL